MAALRKHPLGSSSGEVAPARSSEASAVRSSGRALVGKLPWLTHFKHVFSISYRDGWGGPRRTNSLLTSWPTPPSRCLRAALRVASASARMRGAVAARRMRHQGVPRVTFGGRLGGTSRQKVISAPYTRDPFQGRLRLNLLDQLSEKTRRIEWLQPLRLIDGLDCGRVGITPAIRQSEKELEGTGVVGTQERRMGRATSETPSAGMAPS